MSICRICGLWGDTDSSMTVGLPGTTAADRLGYTIMDKGSFIGKVGLEAEKGPYDLWCKL